MEFCCIYISNVIEIYKYEYIVYIDSFIFTRLSGLSERHTRTVGSKKIVGKLSGQK